MVNWYQRAHGGTTYVMLDRPKGAPHACLILEECGVDFDKAKGLQGRRLPILLKRAWELISMLSVQGSCHLPNI
jgi:hypothetical protein